MEARTRRVSGGFPGYDGPALPRAMRSHRVWCSVDMNGTNAANFVDLVAVATRMLHVVSNIMY